MQTSVHSIVAIGRRAILPLVVAACTATAFAQILHVENTYFTGDVDLAANTLTLTQCNFDSLSGGYNLVNVPITLNAYYIGTGLVSYDISNTWDGSVGGASGFGTVWGFALSASNGSVQWSQALVNDNNGYGLGIGACYHYDSNTGVTKIENYNSASWSPQAVPGSPYNDALIYPTGATTVTAVAPVPEPETSSIALISGIISLFGFRRAGRRI